MRERVDGVSTGNHISTGHEVGEGRVYAQTVQIEVEAGVDVRNDGAAIWAYVAAGLQEGHVSKDNL